MLVERGERGTAYDLGHVDGSTTPTTQPSIGVLVSKQARILRSAPGAGACNIFQAPHLFPLIIALTFQPYGWAIPSRCGYSRAVFSTSAGKTAPSILVTGGLGFIGSAFVRDLSRSHPVLCLDAGTYAADAGRIAGCPVETVEMDVRDPQLLDLVLDKTPDILVHFAAETHVTRSEGADDLFFDVNVEGTRNVIEAARSAGTSKVLHISTDEVYGSATDHPFKEDEKLEGEGRATSPYARSKALADDLAMMAGTELPVVVARPTNCFGPWQHPEKAIPRWITRALRDQVLPVWGDGLYVRDWLHVSDAVAALTVLLDQGAPGVAYNIGPQADAVSNREVALRIADLCRVSSDRVQLTNYDRPSHDRRYSVDATRMRELGWEPQIDLSEGLRQTVDWYRTNEDWWRPLITDAESLYSDVSVSGR